MTTSSNDDLARVLNVNRVREAAAEDAAWILAFWQPLMDAGMEPDHAMSLTQQWLEAQMTPEIVEVEAPTSQRDDHRSGT